jgi:putative protease
LNLFYTNLKVGEKIRIVGGKETDFDQKVSSMQIDHKEVKTAKKGSSVGMKVDEKVHEGYKVFKV